MNVFVCCLFQRGSSHSLQIVNNQKICSCRQINWWKYLKQFPILKWHNPVKKSRHACFPHSLNLYWIPVRETFFRFSCSAYSAIFFSSHDQKFFTKKCLKLETTILVRNPLNFAIVLSIFFSAALNDGDRVLQVNH